MKVSRLHEEFITLARRPMSFGNLPVMPKDADVPLIPVNKWQKINGKLKKTYSFRLKEQKVRFVKELLDYELEAGHNADMEVSEDKVTLYLQTRDIEQITELDKEYAKHSDVLYRDVVYSVEDE